MAEQKEHAVTVQTFNCDKCLHKDVCKFKDEMHKTIVDMYGYFNTIQDPTRAIVVGIDCLHKRDNTLRIG